MEEEARERGAKRISELGGVEYLASLIVGGAEWQDVANQRSRDPDVANVFV